jgi:hypothetical protein
MRYLAALLIVCFQLSGQVADLGAKPLPTGGGQSLIQGPGILIQNGEIKVNPDASRTYLTGSVSFPQTAIPPPSTTTPANGVNCKRFDISAPGAVIGDRMVVGAPAELLTFSVVLQGYAISQAGVASIRLCNFTTVSITIPSWTWNVDVVKSY